MSKRFSFELDLPDDVAADLGHEDLSLKAKEALVMEFLREHRISQGKAAEVLGVPRSALSDLMSKYRVPVVDLTAEELGTELERPLPET
jgi:predicted XRE-type DNA-binding protein